MEGYISVTLEDEQVFEMDRKYAGTSVATDKVDSDMMRIVSQIDNHMSNLDIANIKTASDVEERLAIAQERILIWDSDESMIWDCEPDEAYKYLRAVDEVRRLIESLQTFQWTEDSHLQNDLLCRAHSILQLAMTKLEEEFIHLLVQYHQLSESDHMSFRSSEDFPEDFSSSSFAEDSVKGRLQRDSGNCSDDSVIDLIIPSAHPDIKCIAEVMFLSNYDNECCQAYINVRKEALDECLSFLHVEKLSIEEVLQIDWKSLYGKISRWNKAMKVFIRVYLSSEKHLCDHIFGVLSDVASRTCFYESSKASMLQLLNFGEAIAVGPSSPDKLFRILDMYEGLADVLPDIKALFEVPDSCILIECHEVMLRLGEFARASITELQYSIQSNTSTTAFSGGGVHPLTKYVMNYAMVIPDYSATLNFLLEGLYAKNIVENNGEQNSSDISPVALALQSIAFSLESNLDGKAKLYQDASLQHLFMMNNIHYMVKKVRNSDLRLLLGDDWVRTHNRKYRQHAMSYERASWNPILSFLRDEGIRSTSNIPSKTVLKERFRGFNLAFEEIYRAQTAWHIPDADLQEDLRISISLKLLQAYRTFTGRYASHLDSVRHRERFIKYSQDDLENYILDFFAGSAKSLHNSFRR